MHTENFNYIQTGNHIEVYSIDSLRKNLQWIDDEPALQDLIADFDADDYEQRQQLTEVTGGHVMPWKFVAKRLRKLFDLGYSSHMLNIQLDASAEWAWNHGDCFGLNCNDCGCGCVNAAREAAREQATAVN